MPKKARAVVTVGERFEIREYPVPDPEPGAILLKQELAGICGTDLHNWEHGRLDGEIIYGHENVGTVHTLGEGVTADYLGRPLSKGDRVEQRHEKLSQRRAQRGRANSEVRP